MDHLDVSRSSWHTERVSDQLSVLYPPLCSLLSCVSKYHEFEKMNRVGYLGFIFNTNSYIDGELISEATKTW
jgi:hypothetical protein